MSLPDVVETVAGLQARLDAVRATGASVGFVPTMGYLHEGHASLIDAAVAADDLTVVSIFVNPLQFAPDEDLAEYPRDVEADLACCGDHGADLVFHPSASEVYPVGAEEPVVVGAVGGPLEGASRPSHFAGVATVVARLFRIMGCCRAYFGEKDFQQMAVVRRMAVELELPVEVVGCPIVREADGLALSSRNVYLEPGERRQAPVLYRALLAGAAAVGNGEADPTVVVEVMEDIMSEAPDLVVDYSALVEPDTFVMPGRITTGAEVRLLVAGRLGRTRLVDNVGAVAP
ncbi:MAG: pantoate--beta-alanine ligase [Acidimicrobiaceae bacterium]|jgi:pantoate--beta-alanine ligase|nr:pantoate--beta-alanine ligase [Acidimicrobiaceae bacterium]